MVENYQEMLSSEHSGFIRHNGIRVVSVDEEKSVLTADVTPENSNIWGGVHGGFLYAMADTAAGAFARINYGQHNVTLNGSINYLRSTVQSKALTAVGRPVRVGGHIGFFEVNITDDTGALIARAEINMYFLKNNQPPKPGAQRPLPEALPFSFLCCSRSVFPAFALDQRRHRFGDGLAVRVKEEHLDLRRLRPVGAHLSVTVSSSSAASLAA